MHGDNFGGGEGAEVELGFATQGLRGRHGVVHPLAPRGSVAAMSALDDLAAKLPAGALPPVGTGSAASGGEGGGEARSEGSGFPAGLLPKACCSGVAAHCMSSSSSISSSCSAASTLADAPFTHGQ